MTIPVAHDFTCPWCWIGLHQARRLTKEFGVTFEWLGYELYPDEEPWPEPTQKAPLPANRPPTPSRLELLYAAEAMDPPTAPRPKQMRVRNALLAVEYAKEHGDHDKLVEALYRAYWEGGIDISNFDFLQRLITAHGMDGAEARRAIEERQHLDRLVPFDAEAYARGVYNVPTFFIGNERCAEQPYRVLRNAVVKTTQEVA
jgi:predicted DsbA family dithiol-disulfide isomerase